MPLGFSHAVAVAAVATLNVAGDIAILFVAVAAWIAVSVIQTHRDRRRRRQSTLPASRVRETSVPPPPAAAPPPPPPTTVDARLERDSAFGRLPRALVLTLWPHLDRRSHAAFSRTARWTVCAVRENPKRASPTTLSVRSVADAACAAAMRRYHPRRLECRARDNSFGDWLGAYSATLTDLTLRVSTMPSAATVALAPLAFLTALTALTLECLAAAPTLQRELAHISALTRLQRLRIDAEVASLEPLRRLAHLTELHVGPESVHGDIRALADLPLLTVVRLVVSKPHGDDDDAAYLRPLEACVATLTALDLSRSYNLDDRDGILAPFVGLRDLDLSWSEIATLDSMRNMRRLERLACDGYSGCTLEPLRDLTTLRHLSVSHAQILEDVGALSMLMRLETLAMAGCPAMQDLAPLAPLPALVFLDLENSPKFSDIAPLGCVTTLVELRLRGCDQLTDLRPLANLTRLCTLTLPECGRHPIAWSAFDGLTLLGTPTSVRSRVGRFGRVLESAGDGNLDTKCDTTLPSDGPHPQKQWQRRSPTHHSHPHPLVSVARAFRGDCDWCGVLGDDATADLCDRCDRCDYELCARCCAKLRVKSRDPRWARDRKRRWRRRRPLAAVADTGCVNSLELETKFGGGGGVVAAATADTACDAKRRVLSELILRPPALRSVVHLLPWSLVAW